MSLVPGKIRKLSAYFTVNGQPIYEPNGEVVVQHDSLADEESGRTRDGIMHVNWIRPDIRKFNLTYNALTSEEYTHLAGLMQGKLFTFGYYEGNTQMTIEAYCSMHEYNIKYADPVSKRMLCTDLKVNVIER